MQTAMTPLEKLLSLTKIVSPEEAEKSTFRVCSITRNMPGLLEAVCVDCGRTVFYCKDGPEKPPKICIPCMTERARGENSFGA